MIGRRGLMAVAATITGGIAGFSVYGAQQVISPPRSSHRDDPALWGIPCEEVRFRASDGTPIRAWLSRARRGGPAVIVAHGHGCNRNSALNHARFLFPHYTVLMPDLRGHGQSGGRHTSVGYHERLDLLAAVDTLQRLGFGPIGLLGISMGAASSILAAAESSSVGAVVSDSSFARLRHAVGEAARQRGYPGPIIAPLAYLSCRTAALRLGHRMQDVDPEEAIAAVAPRPLLLIHGADDRLVSVDDAYRLYCAAREPKELWVIPGVKHAAGVSAASSAYAERVLSFLGGAL